MISEITIKSIHALLSDEEKDMLKLSIIEIYGEDVGQKVDKNPGIQDSINQLIYEFVKSKYSDQVERIIFDANESVDKPLKNEVEDEDLKEVTRIKDYAVSADTRSEATIENTIDSGSAAAEQPIESGIAREAKKDFNYNLILDGRTKSSIFIEKLLGGLDEESREIIIKCLLYISIFVSLISMVLIILNTSNINQIQTLYEEGQRNFLFQYTDICNVDVRQAKGNPCVISEINKRISDLSNSRFWNTMGLGIFSVLSLFFFYQISTYRQSRDEQYN